MPTFTWMATAMAVKYVGAKVVFVDIEPDTLCMDPQAFEVAIMSRTRAVIPVHILGSMADMEKILAIAGKHGIHVIVPTCRAASGMVEAWEVGHSR